jgi:biotin-dependent carboxylase-like uncharacterized protein
MIKLIATGSGLSLQDLGRRGWRRFGVPVGGAMDPKSLMLANTLLGNSRDATALEIVQQGARLQVQQNIWLALAGADFCPELSSGTARLVRAGEELHFSQRATGWYAYLAVPGGFHATKYLGSTATDPRNGMGLTLHAGDCLKSVQLQPNVTVSRVGRRITCNTQAHMPRGMAHFKLYPGPQFDSFSLSAKQQLISGTWTVSQRSDRTGYGLTGPVLEIPKSIPSEPVLPGSFQVPGSGQPIVTMIDGPTVGGYAKIAVLKEADLARFAQCVPGTQLTFSWNDSF